MLSQAEINALLGALAADTGADGESVSRSGGRVVRPYDFRRPDKVSREQVRALHAIHESIARNAGAHLSARLRMPVTMTAVETSQQVYEEFVSGMTLPSQLVALDVPSLGGPFLLDVDLGLALGWIDRVLGGPGRLSPQRREPTPIEHALILRIIGDLVLAIREGWEHLEPIAPVVADTALAPAMLRIAAPSHVVVVARFAIRVGGQVAPISLCMPHTTLESVLPRLGGPAWEPEHTAPAPVPAANSELAGAISAIEVPVAAVLGDVELTVDELAALSPGDVIRFGERAGDPIRLAVTDQAAALAVPGRLGDRIALRLLTPLELLEA